MSIKYGLISQADSKTLEMVIDGACKYFSDKTINVLEVGLYGGDTGLGVMNYINSKDRNGFITGIDNNKDGEKLRYEYSKLIIGNSNEVYNQIEDQSQHIIIIDACHCFTCVISDFYAYASKLKYHGMMLFHDTGKHIKPFTHFQHGDINNPLAYISVRAALNSVLEADSNFYFGQRRRFGRHDWFIRMDEADTENEAGGFIVIEKCY